MNLADLYDADRRTRDSQAARIATTYSIPHPLHGIPYGDGTEKCTHAKRCTTVLGRPTVRG